MTQHFPIRVAITIDGLPAGGCIVRVGAPATELVADEHGSVDMVLPHGRTAGKIEHNGRVHDAVFVHAAGMTRIAVNLGEVEPPLGDARAAAAMPSDRYIPLAVLGRGAAGTVYRCRDSRLERLVAIKILNDDFAKTESDIRDFLTEAQNIARIEHPNLIQIYDVGLHGDLPYLVMQFVDGVDLETLIERDGGLGIGAAAAAGVQLARALEALADAGYLHRDVKPSNGLANRRGEVRLADFGLVRPIVDFTDPRSKVFGTPAYMSPEQLQGRPLGPATDVYGLGATIYHLASGKLPFDNDNPILSHITEPPPDIRLVLPDAPEELALLLRRMMAKRPTDRPSAAEIIATLRAVATRVPVDDSRPYLPRLTPSDLGTSSTPNEGAGTRPTPGVFLVAPAVTAALPETPPPTVTRAYPRWLPAVAAAALLVVAGSVYLTLTTPRPESPDPNSATTSTEVVPTPTVETPPAAPLVVADVANPSTATEAQLLAIQEAAASATRHAAGLRYSMIATTTQLGGDPPTEPPEPPEATARDATRRRDNTLDNEAGRVQPVYAPAPAPATTPDVPPAPVDAIPAPVPDAAPTTPPPVIAPPDNEQPGVDPATPDEPDAGSEAPAPDSGRRRDDTVAPPVSF